MARKISLLGALLFSLGIGGALAFGAGTAMAGVNTASACADPNAIAACVHWKDCKSTCQRYGFSGIEAHCMNGCCYCEVT